MEERAQVRMQQAVRQPADGQAADPLLALQRGVQGPFEAFVAREARPLCGFFRRLGVDFDEAEDLTQEVFVRLFQSAPSYRPGDRFVAYVYRIARNVWVDRARRQATRPTLVAQDGPPSHEGSSAASGATSPDPETGLIRTEEGRRLRAAVAELPQAQRLVFELAVMRELSYADVAHALELPVGTVKSRVFYTLRRLRERLARGAFAGRTIGGGR